MSFNMIIDPSCGKKYSIFSQQGRNLLKNMIKLVIGGNNDKICDQINSTTVTNVINICGKTTLRESLAIVSKANFVLASL